MRAQVWRWWVVTVLCVGLAGCRHKDRPAPLPVPPPAPVPVVPVTEPPVNVTPIPTVPAPLTPVVVPAKKLKRARKKAVLAAATPTAPAAPAVTAATPTSPALLGALTAGGDQTAQKQQEAQALIGSLSPRLSALPASLRQSQKDQIAQVMNFEREATRALQAGDADGAVTLATKAKLLLDDLLK